MDDTPVQETQNVSNNKFEGEEIDPLDAYMLEIDEQVQKLDEKDKRKVEEEAKKTFEDALDSPKTEIREIEEDDEEEETIGKAGNFATVEELIA
jgi:hypothetical protein